MPVTLRCQRVDILGVLALVGLIMLCCDSFVSNEEFNSTCKMSVPPGFKLIILKNSFPPSWQKNYMLKIHATTSLNRYQLTFFLLNQDEVNSIFHCGICPKLLSSMRSNKL